MSREAEVEEEERAFERRVVRDSRLSGCSCTELAPAVFWCKASDDAGGSRGSREEDEGEEARTEGEEEGSRWPCRG